MRTTCCPGLIAHRLGSAWVLFRGAVLCTALAIMPALPQAQTARPSGIPAYGAAALVDGPLQARCTPPRVEINIVSQPAPVRNQASVRTMTAYSQSSHATVGLYRASQRVSMRAQHTVSTAPRGMCLTSLQVTYAINHAIDVGSEYRPGSCAYDETLRHERTHERIHLLKAREAQPLIERGLGRQALYFAGASDQQNAQAWLARAAEWTTKVYSGLVLPAQEAFDSPEEYTRFAQACGHEIQGLLPPP